ncbi:DNA polymerase III, delta prime subunit [gut metagenome]|uniref:DNA polymerase III, delta prime subunit n=1 Tax=gut metagenome TaxID=749906 RepID=J9FTG8_9ZZZZ
MFSFKDVIGQDSVKQRLLQEVQEGRIPHAQLFYGPMGVGKLPLALAYARYLCCPHRTAEDACGTCPSCVKWEKLIHPDVHFVFPIINKAKSPKISICNDFLPQWRKQLLTSPYFNLSHWLNELEADNKQAQIFTQESDEIIRKLTLKSSEGGYKITIIWQAEKMHQACANKLLKLLEEPPEKTLFLLITESPEMILPTIISRTQRLHIPPLDEASIGNALYRKYGVTTGDSSAIAHMAHGNFIKALETIHLNEENERFFQWFISLMRLAYQRKIREIKEWSEQLATQGRERQKRFLNYCQRMIRENFIYNFHCKELNYLTIEEQNFSSRFAPFVNERNVLDIMEELTEAQLHIEQNVNARMVFFDFSLKMIVLLKQ